jgi:sugar O-acyltransferase (sialic acid O-acetyltransferase NeuD family)
MKPIWVFGAGSHGRVVIDAIRAEGKYAVVGALDDGVGRVGGEVSGIPVRGAIDPDLVARFGIEWGVIAVGANNERAAVARRFGGLLGWASVVHPRAHVAPAVPLGGGTVILAGAVVQPGARVGRHVIVNTAASVDHDNVIGDFAHVAPGARLGGAVEVGEGALVGIGATVVNGRSVGRWAVLGAGAVAVADVPDRVVAVGVPARVLHAVPDGPPEEAR